MRHQMYPLFLLLLMCLFPIQAVNAAKESGSSKTIKKLQAMIQEISTDRDRLNAENAKMAGEFAQVKKDLEQEKKAKTIFEAKEKKLKGEIAAQKSSADNIRSRLDGTTTRLYEVIDKYNALNQAKNQLATEHSNLENTQQFTASELKRCENKNIKMYEGAKQIVTGYDRCRNKGIVDTLMDVEPVTQINNVEFETIVQEYEDKLNKQKFHPSQNPKK
jgi:chromosome segregation ATPase